MDAEVNKNDNDDKPFSDTICRVKEGVVEEEGAGTKMRTLIRRMTLLGRSHRDLSPSST